MQFIDAYICKCGSDITILSPLATGVYMSMNSEEWEEYAFNSSEELP